MKVKTPLDPKLPLFTAAELAAVSGLNRATVDLWGNRDLLRPTRRERMPRSTKARPRKGRGRPMFSVAAIFRARLVHYLGTHLGIGLSEWIDLAGLLEAAELLSGGEEWMEAVAHAIETDRPFKLTAYAACIDGSWQLKAQAQIGAEVKVEEQGFGGAIPYIVIPISDIFGAVYRECKKLLGKE